MNPDWNTDVLIVGSGAAAAALAPVLVDKGYSVLVAEAASRNIDWGRDVKERGCKIYKPEGRIPASIEDIFYYRHLGFGGTVEISCANAVRPSRKNCASLEIDIETELREVEEHLNVQKVPESFVGYKSARLISSAMEEGYEMRPMPKFIDFGKCQKCGLCEVICPNEARWSTRRILEQLEKNKGLSIIDNFKIERVDIKGRRARSAVGVRGEKHVRINADNIVLAAGGIGTPIILQNSGIEAGGDLFLDLYVTVYGKSHHFDKSRDVPMAAVYQDPQDDFILSPYLDIDLWYAIEKMEMSKWLNGKSFSGLMVKIADTASGMVHKDGKVNKDVTEEDTKLLERGIYVAKRILLKAGAENDSLVVTTPKGAHPGGTAAIGRVVDQHLCVKGMENLFVVDASAIPVALGKPPILTIMALARSFGKTFAL